MTQAIERANGQDYGAMIERVVIHGDLSQLKPAERAGYYKNVCESLGLNPLTRPFEYLKLNGKEILYARRDCTDQLRQIHKVSVNIVARERIEDIYVVTARATLPSGRADESTGAVNISALKGENLANALMKAETKAKRRVTLSICGLAVLDEAELDTVPQARMLRSDPETGEVFDAMPRISPFGEADPSADYGNPAGLAEALSRAAQLVELRDLAGARELLGTRAAGGEITRAIQTEMEANNISPDYHKQLSKEWARLDRLCVKLEKEQANDAG